MYLLLALALLPLAMANDISNVPGYTLLGFRIIATNNDWYNFTGLTISYKLKNKPKKCPKELLP